MKFYIIVFLMASIVFAQPPEPENLNGLVLQVEYWDEVLEDLKVDESSEYVVDCYDNIQNLLRLITVHIESVHSLKEHGDPE